MAGFALLGRGLEVDRLMPVVQLDMAAFLHALGGLAEVLAALLGGAAGHARLLGGVGRIDCAAMRANALRAPAKGFEVGAGRFRRLEMLGVELRHRANPLFMALFKNLALWCQVYNWENSP